MPGANAVPDADAELEVELEHAKEGAELADGL